jgi:hypothetical protein
MSLLVLDGFVTLKVTAATFEIEVIETPSS